MKLLLTADAVGGVWQYATDLARALPAHGIEPVIALLGPAPAPHLAALSEGIAMVETGLPLDWLADSPIAVTAAGARLAELAGDLGCDLVHLNSPAHAAAARFPVPVLAVSHSCLATWWAAVEGGPMPADFAWRAELMRAGLHAAALVAAPSRAHAEATARAYRLADVAAVHNGRAPLPLPDRAQADIAFTAGRLWDRGKGLATLDAAAARARTPFVAAGPLAGLHGERIEAAHLVTTGTLAVGDLAEHLAARPVFVSAARYEPFGLAVLEAAQAGCALVLADIPTFRELWSEAALFVPAGDAAALAQAVDALVAAPERRAALADAARTRAEHYTPQAMAAATAALYRTLAPAERRAA